ncbi:MAG: MucB/RseB C-terminal domain-containing protein [Gammaproteobacteria bacterium]|nr:MucB/RseB C-terminal domain-containing protein [Gammaproteobacteria bacterium]
MPFRRHAGLVLLLLFSLPAPGVEPSSARAFDLLNKMSRAVRTANYAGVFIYRIGPQTDSIRIIQRGGADAEQERLISLNGTPREVIRNKETVTCIYPENQVVMVEKTGPRRYIVQLPEPVERFAAGYTFTVAGEERVAGRDTWVVGVLARDIYRYGYRFSIDKESFLPLRTELRSHFGSTIEEVMFTQIEVLPEIADSDLQPGFSGQGFRWMHAAPAGEGRPAADGRWQVTWMPEGFHISHHERRSLAGSGDTLDHLAYTDGMSSVSIFVERVGDEAPQLGPLKIGGVNAFGRLVRGHQITAVGEVPPATVQRIANSVVSQ